MYPKTTWVFGATAPNEGSLNWIAWPPPGPTSLSDRVGLPLPSGPPKITFYIFLIIYLIKLNSHNYGSLGVDALRYGSMREDECLIDK